MEISFTQEITASVDLSAKQERELAERLGITRGKLIKLANDDELLGEYSDEIIGWLCQLSAEDVEVSDRSDPDNVEIHA
jgi:transcriptional regulator with XRE-family HTH domain